MNTSNSGIARVDGTVSVVVTNSSHVEISPEASSRWIARSDLAFVAIVTVLLCVDTIVGVGITTIVCANVLVITLLGSSFALSVRWIAFVDHAGNGGAFNNNWIHAQIACLGSIDAAIVGVANIFGARVVVIAIDRSVGASDLRIASRNPAFVGGLASDVGKETSSDRVAHV